MHITEQEYLGWIGNIVFISALFIQLVHTYRIKETKDVSYGLCILWVIGNSMYTGFGYIDNSESLFIGSLISLIFSFTQLCQKIYYDNYYIPPSISSYESI